MNWLWVFAILTVLGPILIAVSGKRQPTDKDQPIGVQTGYLCLVLGGFGLLSQWMSFTAVMLVFVLVTGVVTGQNRFVLAKRRSPEQLQPHFVEYARSFFPVILVVFLLRAFLVEPFQIPSSSMRPGLVVGDFILVNKFTYGIRVPVLNNVLIDVNKVKRGDVVVFGFPPNPQVNFIKRVVGLPGDVVEYRDKTLIINGERVKDVTDGTYDYLEQGLAMVHSRQYRETLDGRSYQVLKVEGMPPVFMPQVAEFPFRENCRYNEEGFSCKVPAGHYFTIGDNRDNSHDGRYWGFVPDQLLVGEAFFIWMNFSEPSRIGTRIH